MDATLERLASLIRQLQGAILAALRGTRFAAGRITGGGGSTYSIAGGVGITSVSGTGTGVCRITLDVNAVSTNDVWPTATVVDNTAFTCTCVVISASPVTFDVYGWNTAGAAANRTFTFHCSYAPA